METLVEKIDALAAAAGATASSLDERLSFLETSADPSIEAAIAGMRDDTGQINLATVPPIVTDAELIIERAQSQDTTSYGVDRYTGEILEGWQHVKQSIWVIITTRKGTRLLRRWFGASVPALIDQLGTEDTLLAYKVEIAEALWEFEPRYEISQINFTQAGRDGVFGLELLGVYFPRGHLGDWSVTEDKSLFFALN